MGHYTNFMFLNMEKFLNSPIKPFYELMEAFPDSIENFSIDYRKESKDFIKRGKITDFGTQDQLFPILANRDSCSKMNLLGKELITFIVFNGNKLDEKTLLELGIHDYRCGETRNDVFDEEFVQYFPRGFVLDLLRRTNPELDLDGNHVHWNTLVPFGNFSELDGVCLGEFLVRWEATYGKMERAVKKLIEIHVEKKQKIPVIRTTLEEHPFIINHPVLSRYPGLFASDWETFDIYDDILSNFKEIVN